MAQLRRQVPDSAIVPGINNGVSDIASKRIVSIDTANDGDFVILATAATLKLVGVTNETLVAGHPGDVQREGRTILTSGAAVNNGDRITSNGSGKGIATTTEGDSVIGIARTSTDGADDDFEIDLTPGAVVGA